MNKALAKLKAQQLERKEAMDKIADRAAMRARIELQMEQKRLADIEAKRLRLENEAAEKIRLAEEKRKADIDAKTHKYFEINQYGRKKAVEGMPMYFGETQRIHPDKIVDSAWIPNGFGEFHYNGSIEREGEFINGKLFGKGKYNFKESNYLGTFKEGNMHGDGVLVTSKGREVVLMRNNVKICSQDELMEGKQLEFDDPSLRLYCNGAASSDTLQFKDNSRGMKSYIKGGAAETSGSGSNKSALLANTGMEAVAYQLQSLCPTNGANKIKGSIVRHIYDWRYLIRFDNEVYPRQREIDLSRIQYFKVLHHMPMIIPLDNYTNKLGGTATLRENLDDDHSLAEHLEQIQAKQAAGNGNGNGIGSTIGSGSSDCNDNGGSSQDTSCSSSTQSSPRAPQKSGLRYSTDPKAHRHITNYNTNRNYNSNSKVDTGISYDYYADTFGVVTKPNIQENILFSTLTNVDINNRDQSDGKSAAAAGVTEMKNEQNMLREEEEESRALSPKDSMDHLLHMLHSHGHHGHLAHHYHHHQDDDSRAGPEGRKEEDPKILERQRIQSMDGAYRRTLTRHIVGTKPLTTKQRYTSDGLENVFESRAVGVGAAEEEEQARLRAELKKQQWQALIADRKAKQEAERQQKIKEEQKAMLEEAQQAQQKITQQKKDEADAFQAAVDAAKQEEEQKWARKKL